jgi:RNA polymerase sigma-B factor
MLEQGLSFRSDPEALVAEYVATQKPELKDLIILQYSATVERIARRYSGLEPVDDLIQVGYIGLLNALSKFDPEAGVRFNTYATHLVTGEIKHYLRDRTQTIRHPAWLQELRHKVQRAAAQIQGLTGEAPTDEQVADAAGVSVDAVREARATQDTLKVGSLDATPFDGEESDTDLDRLGDNIVDQESVSVEEKMVLQHAISQLRELEQEVLVLFHFRSLNQTEIAHALGISCNYVSHILRQSHSKLRRILADQEAADVDLRPEDRDDKVIDAATGLYSESYFRSRLGEELHRVSGTTGMVSVLIFELKGLGAYRQFYGSASAAELLADLGDQLKSTVRSLDIVCRYGASGYGVILPSTGATVHAARARLEGSALKWLFARVSGSSAMRLAVGQATSRGQGMNLNELLNSIVMVVDEGAESRRLAA